ncbi:NAD(P)/FAD-dependent oxidoreductase [Candidimonas sp. SYP-B2681]|uniref:flavin-containing monooxygenase n=1 Tax=Candidimonas sp. SYP-B2681 TaxID=2497686 RepID=UPI000F88E1B6|nr:NAD(P)/FAD-dependent oxidoreductase [Candidimonas sp. SYP-B2681]RTZ45518.1 NAD(P)/FAD-dependent oxidoreductase [Candidimonas sp. SYP-B2681]
MDTHMGQTPTGGQIEHFDVVIVGAGMSGLAAAYHLQRTLPHLKYVILDSLESYGGTWLTHSYPGARSDSDLFTFGYQFKPWKGNPIATRSEILSYLGEVIQENGLEPHIRFRHHIASAAWSSEDARWNLEAFAGDSGESVRISTSFLWMCQGYYRHSEGYTPGWRGMDDFKGEIVHPQKWPKDLQYKNKRVVVIGSGATAATLLPAIAEECAHVTMLQRTPTYFSTGRNADKMADELRRLQIKDEWIHEIVRRKVVCDRAAVLKRAKEEPETLKQELLAQVRAVLGADYDVDTHFTPPYRPHQQRVCFVPDGDLFKAIRGGKASVVTDEIEEFTSDGLLLKSGERIDADIIVTATGFNMNFLGDIKFSVDGEALDFSKTVTYRAMMFTGVPNLVWIYGYNRYSWTLRAEIIAHFVCGMLKHMSSAGAKSVRPSFRAEDHDMRISQWVDPDNFNPGYLMRAQHLLPKRGDKPEWRHTQDYLSESVDMNAIDYTHEPLQYE